MMGRKWRNAPSSADVSMSGVPTRECPACMPTPDRSGRGGGGGVSTRCCLLAGIGEERRGERRRLGEAGFRVSDCVAMKRFSGDRRGPKWRRAGVVLKASLLVDDAGDGGACSCC